MHFELMLNLFLRRYLEKHSVCLSGACFKRVQLRECSHAESGDYNPARTHSVSIETKEGYSFMLRSRNQTTNQIPRSYKNDGFDWPFDLVIVT